jgi:chorismate-pyruvate lyase
MSNFAESPPVELEQLVKLFFQEPETELGSCSEIAATEMPAMADRLLNHCEHMTVTVEAFHGTEVDVRVLEELESESEPHYCRKILLSRKSDGGVVQFGVVRLDMSVLPEDVQQKIREKNIPLGRILISHGVMRDVRLAKLYRFDAGTEMARHFGQPVGTPFYGRTAWMFCNGKPAIELLEIVNL